MEIALAPWDEAPSPIFYACSKFLYFNQVNLKSGSYQKYHSQYLKWKTGTTWNAKNKKIEYINFLHYRINRYFSPEHPAHQMDSVPQ